MKVGDSVNIMFRNHNVKGRIEWLGEFVDGIVPTEAIIRDERGSGGGVRVVTRLDKAEAIWLEEGRR